MKPSHGLFTGQNNVTTGATDYPSLSDLTGKEATLVTASNDGGTLKVDSPAAPGDSIHGVVGQPKDGKATVFFPHPSDRIRLRLSGACNPGEALTSVGDGSGQVEAAGAGTAYAIAEEAGTDGQLVLCRKL